VVLSFGWEGGRGSCPSLFGGPLVVVEAGESTFQARQARLETIGKDGDG